MRTAPISPIGLTPRTTVKALVEHPLVDVLAGPELLIYLRLVVIAKAGQRSTATNRDLYRGDARAAVRALRVLERNGLIKIRYASGGLGRTIEVVP